MKIKKILIAGNYEEEFKKYLTVHLPQQFRFLSVEEITDEDLSWTDAYVGFKPSPNFHPSYFKWVHSFNAGVNNYLEIDGWDDQKVLLTRTVCSFGERISEYCLSFILRDLQYHEGFQRNKLEKKWEQKTPKMLRDQTIVIFGTGAIGQEVAKTFSLFGATVYGVSQSGASKPHFKEVADTASAPALVSKADWVISTLPLTTNTNKMFNKEFFHHLNGSFINVGRGATVDEEALIEALDTGKLHSAVLDVLETEPLPESSSLWSREDVIITPHISAVTEINEAIECFLETLRKLENNEPLPNQADTLKGY
ncbi:D-2-hydroxyacid dehydrogenase [Peribacillus saganii]|uniref:D-2-hydroxyacid dehydrogenase n=1 Tax=Peribacillus saganii TaxID=2303992 RepID=A0A372LQ33_9BACI|nr:D-2-hydroxyacid dehydrogenase [Peribacillus saganii]RFU69420.1 D-2-hydroxyacid dehydrogenase [Peribacillus saganii]